MDIANVVIGALAVVAAVVNAWLLFAVKSFKNDLQRLEGKDGELFASIGAVRELVLGKYITREEMKDILQQHTQTILSSVTSLAQSLNRHMDEEDQRLRMLLQVNQHRE